MIYADSTYFCDIIAKTYFKKYPECLISFNECVSDMYLARGYVRVLADRVIKAIVSQSRAERKWINLCISCDHKEPAKEGIWERMEGEDNDTLYDAVRSFTLTH